MNKKNCLIDIESCEKQTDNHTTSKFTDDFVKMPIENVKSKYKNFQRMVHIVISKMKLMKQWYNTSNTDLLLAIQDNELLRAIKSLENGASVDAQCYYTGISVCHIAAYYGADEILNELIKRNANFNKNDTSKRSPLQIASWKGHVKCVEILLKSKYSENTNDTKVFFKHVYSFYTQIIKNKISKIWSGYSALHLASAGLHVECVKALLAAGVSLTSMDKGGLTPLDVCGRKYMDCNISFKTKMNAIETSFWKTLEEFVAHMKEKNIKYDTVQNSMNDCAYKEVHYLQVPTTPLHFAVLLDSKRSIELLHTEVNAFVGCQNKDGNTPLHTAAENKKEVSLLTLTHLCSKKSLKDKVLDIVNKKEQTPLHLAIASNWINGVDIFSLNGSNFLLRDNTKKTVFHMAVESKNAKILQYIGNNQPNCNKLFNSITNQGFSPLYIAITENDFDCVQEILKIGDKLIIQPDGNLPSGFSELHNCAVVGNKNILLALLNSKHKDKYLKNAKDSICRVSPLHLATDKNNLECLKILLDEKFSTNIKAPIPPYDNEMLMLSIKKNKPNESYECLPFHIAAHKGQKECIRLFIEHGADISEVITYGDKEPRKVLDIITNNMHSPVEYLEDLCNSFISVNEYHLDDPLCEIKLDYSFLTPPMVEENKIMKKYGKGVMRVVEVLTSPNSSYDQKRLIAHPLIESFQYLQWKALKKFFFYILATYCCFVISLTVNVIIIYKYERSTIQTPTLLYKPLWETFLWITMAVVLLQDFLFLSAKKLEYLKSPAAVIKMGSLVLSLMVSVLNHNVDDIWPRYVTAGAILMAWIEIVILLSRFPEFGYLYQMFATVAFRVLKVMALFGGFMIIGFSLAFWILFKSKYPFDGPWNSIIKTIVMMTSEFDYSDMAGEKGWIEYPSFPQILFVIFLVSLPIVVMNLLVALAVSDTKDLETDGKIQRLFEQLQFLSTLDLIGCTPLWNLFPECLKHYKKSCLFESTNEKILTLKPTDMKKHFSKNIIASIYQVVITKKNKLHQENSATIMLASKIENMQKAIDDVKKKKNNTKNDV